LRKLTLKMPPDSKKKKGSRPHRKEKKKKKKKKKVWGDTNHNQRTHALGGREEEMKRGAHKPCRSNQDVGKAGRSSGFG